MPPILWTRQFVGERWPEPITPLSASLMVERFVGEYLYYPRMQRLLAPDSRPIRVVRGHVYMNATLFRSLFEQAHFPVPDFILELFPTEFRRQLQELRPGLPSPRLVALALYTFVRDRLFERIDLNVPGNPRNWQRFEVEYNAEVCLLAAQDLSALSSEELLAFLKRVERLLYRYRRIHLGSLLIGNCIYQVFGMALKRWTNADPEGRRAQMVAGLPGSKTLETNKALWALARIAEETPATRELFLSTPAADLHGALAATGHEHFQRYFQAFLEEYGHRCHNSYELGSVSWSRDPGPVLEAVQSYVRDSQEQNSPLAKEAFMVRERLAATAETRRELKERAWIPWLPLRRMLFDRLLRLTQDYMLLRENQRFAFDRVLLVMKDALAEVGRRASAAGLLERPTDILFARFEEVPSLLQGSAEAANLLQERKLLYQTARRYSPPTYLLGDQPYSEPTLPTATLRGLGVSPGVTEGRVRIIHVPDDFTDFQEGEILVTTGTDPGWTPLFLRAKGLITEIGGLLSHGAVVAREYGMPAVVGVSNVTHLLHTGQRVALDGRSGEIRVLS